MEDPKFLPVTVATSYARELVKFIVQQHNIEGNVLGDHEIWRYIPRVFHTDVGKVVVAYAKGQEKTLLIRRSAAVGSLQTCDKFYSFCVRFRDMFFEHNGFAPDFILKYFVHVIENSILLYLKGLLEAPVVAVDVITDTLMIIKSGRFVVTGGLESLNEVATRLLAEDPFLMASYERGTFAW